MPSRTTRRSSASSSSRRRRRRSERSTSRAGSSPRRAGAPDRGEQPASLRPFWSGTLTFGLVSIPVDLYPGTRGARVGLRMLTPDGSPVARRYACPEDGALVPSDELTRGYEYEPGKYVQVTDEELEALEPQKSRDIDLRLFVEADSLDPLYFERTYFLMPSGTSSKAYHLLASVMERGRRAGIATFVMRDREYLVAIFAHDGLLCAEALRFHDEVRAPDRVELPERARVDASTVKALERFISKQPDAEFEPDALRNEHNEALRALAAAKAKKRKDIVQTSTGADEDGGEAETVDLMRLLKQSLR